MTSSDGKYEIQNPAQFATTRWSLVLSAAQRSSPESGRALEQLCRAYWPPLYAYVRRRGYSQEDSSDLTQEFFARILEKRFLGEADPAKGKFRSYLLASMQHFLANEWDRASAQRRGGGRSPLSFDAGVGEGWYQLEPVHKLTAEKIFERRWALTLLDLVLQRLRAEYANSDKDKVFEALKPMLIGDTTAVSYRELGCELSMSEGAIKVAVHRLRRQYKRLLVDEIAQTVTGPEEIEEELQALLAAVGD